MRTFLGYTFSLDGGFDDQAGDESTSTSAFVSAFTSVLDYILNCGCFFYIGAWFPWEDFTSSDLGISPWRLVVLCIGILILRRVPAILALYKWVPEIKDRNEALFCGHFGEDLCYVSHFTVCSTVARSCRCHVFSGALVDIYLLLDGCWRHLHFHFSQKSPPRAHQPTGNTAGYPCHGSSPCGRLCGACLYHCS